MTILEVLIAVLILSGCVAALMHLMVSGDRVGARRTGISGAAMLAQNQIETIRRQDRSLTIAGDTVYEEGLNGIDYTVRRTRLKPAGVVPVDSTVYTAEYAVIVTRKNLDAPLVAFRLVQGFTGEHAAVR